MLGVKIKFTDTLNRWLGRLPGSLKRVEGELQAEAMHAMPEPQSDGENAVYAAMGWNAKTWNDEAEKALMKAIAE
jgi:hypothetical protein